VVMVWRVATLPMPCYIVRKITTVSVPKSYAGYLRTLQRLWRCDFTFAWSFHSVTIVICDICDYEQRKYLWIWSASCESWIGGVGNKTMTSKFEFKYQRLDGEADISCRW
jgi:hypothetical protein